ncbi:MAG TPA: FAD-dependent oxidoreductase [Acidimicrobiales bacterium]
MGHAGGILTPETRDRRQFLHDAARAVAAATSAALFGSLAGCSGSGSGAAKPTTSVPPTSSTTELLDSSAWSSLSASLQGTLVLPAASSYANDKLVYNLRFADIDPAAIAFCASAADVRRCVTFARDHGIAATPRSGGHSYGGYSTGPGLVIDVSPMNIVTADRASMTAVIGAGTQLVDVYQELANAGVLLPAGSCPTVGIAGLTLGGGIGVVGRKYGLTCDNLTALNIVTADGRMLTASADENADLYWASRGGGGGNFGIATSFTFGLHPLPELALFTINWPAEAAADVLGQWQQWMADAPDELWSNCQLQSAGSDGLNVHSNGVFVGSPDALTAALQPLLRAGTPSSQFVGPETYLHAMLVEAGCEDLSVSQCHLSGESPGGTLPRSAFAATSAYLTTALSSAGIDAAIQSIEQLHQTDPEVGGGLVFDSYGGAINAVAADATAFVHRSALCGLQSSVSWGAGAASSTVDGAQAWLAGSAKALAPFVSKTAYQNYIDPTLVDWADAYYGANLPRLVEVKRRHDPDDVFHFAQSIPTTLPP